MQVATNILTTYRKYEVVHLLAAGVRQPHLRFGNSESVNGS